MGEEQGRSVGQRLVHASCGALLGALIVIGVQFWLPGFYWWPVGLGAIFGFLLGWFVGGEAIDFLKTAFWWS